MESEKVKEIKKAINCCISGNDCTENCCIYYKNKKSFKCMDDLLKDTLTLINELESENERLLEQRNKTYNIWVKDTEKLKDRISELEKENKDYYDRLNNLQTYIDNHEEIWKVNTKMQLKQFAERLKEKAIVFFDEGEPIVLTSNIDETLIETTEGI